MRAYNRDMADLRPSTELPAGEEVERAVKATLLQGKASIPGTLFLTNRRLLFEAKTGDARWMVVPFDEIASVGLHRAALRSFGPGSSRNQCFVVITDKDEQVWWDFNNREEKEWLPLVEQRIAARER